MANLLATVSVPSIDESLLIFPTAPSASASFDSNALNAENAAISVASALCLLSYSNAPSYEYMNQEQYRWLRESQLLENVWSLKTSEADAKTILIGWSNVLDAVFVAFRGSVTVEDWITNFRFTMVFERNTGWAVQEGYSQRVTTLPIPLLQHLVGNYRTVLCGHSLG
jgi:hypothetical protein